MAAQKFLAIIGNVVKELAGLVVSTGASDAGKLVALGDDGKLDESLLPTGIGANTKVAPASEALAAGDQVNVFNAAGALKVRKASAADSTKPAHGFVKDNVATGSNATVYLGGLNSAVAGLVPGTIYVLDAATPGGVVAQAAGPAGSGNILQIVGVATATGELEQSIDLNFIVRA